MTLPTARLPIIPAETRAAAAKAFRPGTPHLAIGDQADELLAGIALARLDPSASTPAPVLARLALGTCLQYVEGLSDGAAADAIRQRADWKYAMHLPLNHPGFDAKRLCGFRQMLLSHAEAESTFAKVVERLAGARLLPLADPTGAGPQDLLAVVCGRARAADMEAAVSQALESLAAHYPEWLRANALHQWYERYTASSTFLCRPRPLPEWEAVAVEIGIDAKYLLTHLPVTGWPAPEALPEIRALTGQWLRQYMLCREGQVLRSPLCQDCRASKNLSRRPGGPAPGPP